MACSLRSAGITPLPHSYGAVRPSPAHRYFRPRGWRRLRLFPWHRRVGSHVPYKSLVELRAAYMPEPARAAFRATPELVPGDGSTPGFDIVYPETPGRSGSGSCSILHVEAEVLDATSELGNSPGRISLDEIVGAEILVEGAVFQHVVDGRED